jgi:uncharacterized cupredoxin-like copper-binding protein
MTKRVIVLFAVAALFPAACSSDKGGVDVTESDYRIELGSTTAPAGAITFNVKNDAEQTHEFVVFKTDLAPDQLPTNADGDVDEKGEGVTHIDEIEDVTAGSTKSLKVNLDVGGYVLICNLPGHYRRGMHTAFTVS